MHMSDALVSPGVGAALWTLSAATSVYCARKVRQDLDESKVPLMGVVGAFVFAAQMLNFQIPGTGSSGHIGGALLLAVMLGPHAAFLVMASVLTVQALFFADGGLLALGANIFNLGLLPSFIAYPFVYRAICRAGCSRQRMLAGSVLAALTAAGLGATAVVFETSLSGVTELPPGSFLLMMLPIHAAIGLLEGLITAAVLQFVLRAQPDILDGTATSTPRRAPVRLFVGFLFAALICAAILSLFASANPDGLEWSIRNIAGIEDITGASESRVHRALAGIQHFTAVLPDYAVPGHTRRSASDGSLAGVLGAGLVLSATLVGAAVLKRRAKGRDSR